MVEFVSHYDLEVVINFSGEDEWDGFRIAEIESLCEMCGLDPQRGSYTVLLHPHEPIVSHINLVFLTWPILPLSLSPGPGADGAALYTKARGIHACVAARPQVRCRAV